MIPSDREIIEDIISNPHRLRESYILNNYPGLYDKILIYIESHNLRIDIPFKEKLWYFVNNITDEKLCKICNNRVKFNRNFKNGYKDYCSSKCTQQNPDTKRKRRKTTIEKYGVDNVAKSDKIKKITEETNIEKYGHKSSFQNIEVRNKWKETIKEKYGVDHIFQSEETKEKIKKTTLERYGVEYYVQSDEYFTKLVNHNLQKYGVRFYQHTDEYRKKTKSTNLERYDCEFYINSLDFKEKTEKFLYENGVEYTSQLPEVINKNKERYRLNKIKRFEDHGFIIKSQNERFMELLDLNICGHIFEINKETLKKRLKEKEEVCTKCNKISKNQSKMELDLSLFIKENYSGNIETSDRDVLGGMELDIYLPDKKLSLEFNGLYWHSDIYKDRKYHLNKTEMCESEGIQLLHIWEDDWLYKEDIVKSIILNKLGKIQKKIYARKCEIRDVSTEDSRLFLNDNHIQGYSNSKYKIGLYHNDVLVSLMTFGDRYINGKKETELIRFCNILNTNVIGGASKLFKYFIKNHEFDTIKSYADISLFDGELYKKLGFEYIHRSSPNYFWVIDELRKHRFNYNKKKLIKEGYDPNMTEKEIMESRGYFKIWGTGQDLYLYRS